MRERITDASIWRPTSNVTRITYHWAIFAIEPSTDHPIFHSFLFLSRRFLACPFSLFSLFFSLLFLFLLLLLTFPSHFSLSRHHFLLLLLHSLQLWLSTSCRWVLLLPPVQLQRKRIKWTCNATATSTAEAKAVEAV